MAELAATYPERPGFFFCVGPDSTLLKSHIAALLKQYPPKARASGGLLGGAPQKGWESLTFWGDEELPDKFWEELTLQGLFASPKALVVRNAHNLTADIWKKLSLALGSPNETAWPMFCLEVDFERGKAKIPAHILKLQCWEFAEKRKWIQSFPPLDAKGKQLFARKEADALGLDFAPGAFEAVCAVLPSDATAIRMELEKLYLAVPPGKPLAPEQAALVNDRRDLDIFAFLRALQSGHNPEQVWAKAMKDSSEGESGIFYFLSMLLREARLMWQILAGEDVFLTQGAASAKSGMAKTLGFPGLARIWDLALAAEKGIKSGERSPEQAQEKLLAELFTLFRRA